MNLTAIQTFEFQAIGRIHSPFKEKFGIPRQPGLTPSLKMRLELLGPAAQPETLRGIEGYSHLWIVFVFSATAHQGWKPLVRPPRLGGNQKLGVFATRSTFRPNPIGLSVVTLEEVETSPAGTFLHLSGADFLDQTPVLDIKPYLPYADALPEAFAAIAPSAPQQSKPLYFSAQAAAACTEHSQRLQQPLHQQISEILSCDPRPAYQHQDTQREYGLRLYDLNLRFRIDAEQITLLSLTLETSE
ncbi:tRNA (N6-threonylcarbamoyladenosine(37)-N6)-methyltransferase TrmO [Nitrincola tapanii]|uniref:tRNA (N6-threonylcarbamoyladenosine(37)-N6)-methyltransferase TrmO n=1 Tax=Nitrincola tapanii TaxID=1708751 RepID=UPI001EFFA232|nr:tRNA (N6-threonylcarbamoyladenosine(37)-N6)-methyltransferase TrmO [Nitrincola tapanii]